MARKANAMSTLSTTMRFRLRGSVRRTVLLKPMRMPWLLVPEKGEGGGHREAGSRAHCQLSHKEMQQGFPGGTVVKNPPANAGDTGSSSGPGRSHMPQATKPVCHNY